MPMKIVVVDDNKTNLMIVEKILRKAGYNRLLKLTSAAELYQYLELDSPNPGEVPVDLILMDMMMPEIDGIEACRTVLANERYSDLEIPIRWPRRWMREPLIMC
jgi:CheY-like chemotaxis protein